MILSALLRRVLHLGAAKPFARRQLRRLLQQGHRHQQHGDYLAAQEMFERACRLDPGNCDANYRLGALLGKRGQLQRAEFHLRQAIAANPGFAGSHAALGNVYLLQEDTAAAAQSYRESVRLSPDDASSHSNLGLIYYSDHQFDLAHQHFARAYELTPDKPGALRDLTLAWIGLEQFEPAHSFLRELLNRQPGNFEALRCVGLLLHKAGRPHEALEIYGHARGQNALHPELLLEYGMVLQELGRIDEAIECYDSAVCLNPDFVLARWHRCLAYLLRHDFARGWPDYELRKISADQPQRVLLLPEWHGEALDGRRMLVYSEQGLGDEIMFASCLRELRAKCGHCVIECSPKLATLFRRSFADATVYATTAARDFPKSILDTGVELQMAIGSVPRYLRRSLSDFPRHGGYLRADPERIQYWHRRLAALGPGVKVGISWRGGTPASRRRLRSLPLAQWLPILRTPHVRMVNLQYDDCAEELRGLEMSTDVRITDWPEVRADYDETAALVSALDLVISVCTAVVHLGGSLGRPVWVLTPFSPEWRYGFEGDTMPWYPSVRLFRQPSYGEWEPVIGQVSQALDAFASARPSVRS